MISDWGDILRTARGTRIRSTATGRAGPARQRTGLNPVSAATFPAASTPRQPAKHPTIAPHRLSGCGVARVRLRWQMVALYRLLECRLSVPSSPESASVGPGAEGHDRRVSAEYGQACRPAPSPSAFKLIKDFRTRSPKVVIAKWPSWSHSSKFFKIITCVAELTPALMGSVSEATQNRSTRSATESECTPRIATGLDFLGLGISSPEVDSTVITLCRKMVVTMYRKATHDSQHCLCRGPRLLGLNPPTNRVAPPAKAG